MQHLGRGGSAALVHPVGVVHGGRPVDAEADQEPVPGQQLAPLVGEERAVGLDGVLDPLSRPAELVHQRHRATEEVDAHERGLTALPGDGHVAVRVCPQQLAQIGPEDVVRHPEAVTGVERLLGQEEAVLAVQVADRTGGLGQDVERGRACRGRTVGRNRGGPRPARVQRDGCRVGGHPDLLLAARPPRRHPAAAVVQLLRSLAFCASNSASVRMPWAFRSPSFWSWSMRSTWGAGAGAGAAGAGWA